MKILLIDDDPIAARVLQAQLQSFGHQLRVENNADAAWQAVMTNEYPVVVSDWMMPGVDGLEFCRRLRRRREGGYIYFILISSMPNTRENVELALKAGVDDFLSKDMPMHELWAILHMAGRILRYANQVQRLESLVLMCSYGRHIKDDNEVWEAIEQYITEHKLDVKPGHIKPPAAPADKPKTSS